MLNFKTQVDNVDFFQQALLRRAGDYGPGISELQRNNNAKGLLQRHVFKSMPDYGVMQPLYSNFFSEYLRDMRFYINLDNLSINTLEQQVMSFVNSSIKRITLVRKEAQALDSTVVENEIKINQVYDIVHFNAFSRESDMPLSLLDTRWMQDYKSEISFDPDQQLSVVDGSGLILPLTDKVRIPFISAELVGEETDVGDTKEPLVSTDPRYLIIPNKVFKHIIIRLEHDSRGRKYTHSDSRCTIALELPGIQMVNYLRIMPAGVSSILIDSIKYLNESNELVELSSSVTEGDTGFCYFFEPIRTRKFVISFIQYAPVTKLGLFSGGIVEKELNRFLAGIDWAYRFQENNEYIEGRVFDFSIESIETGLNTYLNSGFFRSKDIVVKDIASVSITDSAELVPITSRANISGNPDNSVPNTDPYTDFYLGVKITNTNGTKVLEDLIPITDTYPVQTEYLPLVGGQARVKLFPDLLWNGDRNRILEGETLVYPQMLLVTEAPHGYSIGDSVNFVGPADNTLSGLQEVIDVIDDYTFVVVVNTTHTTIDANTTPRVYALSYDPSTPPFTVFKDGSALVLGTDYQISFGEIDYWRSILPNGSELLALLRDARSGKFRVKITKPDYEGTYWINYKPQDRQYLGKTKHVKLINGKAVFDKVFRKNSTVLNAVCVLRNDMSNPYITVILRNYALKIKSY
jgi:hypothetical protein